MRTPSPLPRQALAGLAAACAALATPAAAQSFLSTDFPPPGEETLTIGLGGIVNQFDTKLRLDGASRQGTDFTLEKNSAADNLSSFEATATWRAAPRHRMDFQYYSAKRSGTREYEGTIDIGGTTFPVGASVSIESKNDLLVADYRYSFMKTPQVEVAAILGFYGGKFTFDVDAVGLAGTVQAGYHRSVSTTLPLPLLGASVDWYPDRQWKLAAAAMGMKADVGDVDGRAFVAMASVEYLIVRNFGAGLRYQYTDLKADVSKSDFTGNLGWRTNGVSLYGKFVF